MEWRQQRRWELAALALAGLLLAYAVIASAWVCDDAYISFRTVDNFLHGYGLRWNIGERVQTFTHPLWLFLITPATALAGDPYPAALALSFILVGGAVFLFVRFIAESAREVALGIVILAASKSFVDYSTSGLENPLTFFLLAAFAAGWLRLAGPRRQLALGLIAGLLMLNRMDTILLTLPALAVDFWQERSPRTALRLAAGFAPFLAWELFALFYFGFPFPNTAYAKLHTGIQATLLLRMGLNYLAVTTTLDPVILPATAVAILLSLRRQSRRLLPLAAGMVLYLAYTVKIGGDFMAGRFLTAPFVWAAMLLASMVTGRRARLAVLAALLAAVALNPRSPLRTTPDYGRGWPEKRILFAREVADERAFYYPSFGMLGPRLPQKWAELGRRLRADGVRLVHQDAVGYCGFFAGPTVTILDSIGLADPLLSRIYPLPEPSPRAGHYRRYAPIGYWPSLLTGEDRIVQPDLAEYYRRLRLVVSAPLFAPGRMAEIVRFLTGGNDRLLSAYEATNPRPVDFQATEIDPGPKPPPGMVSGARPALITFARPIRPYFMELEFDPDQRFRLLYLSRGAIVFGQEIGPGLTGNRVRKFWPPEATRTAGIDALMIYPVSGPPVFEVAFGNHLVME